MQQPEPEGLTHYFKLNFFAVAMVNIVVFSFSSLTYCGSKQVTSTNMCLFAGCTLLIVLFVMEKATVKHGQILRLKKHRFHNCWHPQISCIYISHASWCKLSLSGKSTVTWKTGACASSAYNLRNVLMLCKLN